MTDTLRGALLAWGLLASSAAPALTPASGAQGQARLDAILAAVDGEWPAREEPGKMELIRAQLAEAERLAPAGYGVLWRQARVYFWLADDPTLPDAERSRLGKRGWSYGDRATEVNPRGVEGWFFAAVGVGNYGLGIGILKALGEGIEGQFKDRLTRAQELDPDFYAGAIWNAWGRFYFKLPWPKYDPRRSEAMLQKALKVNPDNVRARVFLAELYEREGHPREARKLLQEAVAHHPGSYDGPEERRAQREATRLLEEMKR